MKISVIGLGYLGATHAVAMASLGHEVIGIEPNKSRVSDLKQGKIPFHEPGLQQALDQVLETGQISFQEQHDENSASAQIHFICVGTPQTASSNAADTSYVFAAAKELAQVLRPESLVVGKSTVPVGTARELINQIGQVAGFEPKLVWNPEFLREGTALEDSLHPDRIVIGSQNSQDNRLLLDCYQTMLDENTPLVEVDLETAELVKVAANAFLATKISFINAMAEIAEASGADAVKLAEAIGMDQRIGNKFLRTGIGFGGGCLPKDIRGFIARAEELGVPESLGFLKEVDGINKRRRQRVIELATAELGELGNKKITMLGISFKPDSDDLRDSPALEIALGLKSAGANVYCHDPISLDALARLETGLEIEPDLNNAIRAADLVILGTEWKQYRELDPGKLESPNTKIIIDGRNVLDVSSWQQAGWKVIALGRNIQNA